MGLFDTFIALCPECGEEIHSQTKSFSCCLRALRPGDRVMSTTMRDYADHCDNANCETELEAVIEDGIFIGFEKYDHSIKNDQITEPKNELTRKELKMLLNNALYYMRCDCGEKCSCGQAALRSRIEDKALGRCEQCKE